MFSMYYFYFLDLSLEYISNATFRTFFAFEISVLERLEIIFFLSRFRVSYLHYGIILLALKINGENQNQLESIHLEY